MKKLADTRPIAIGSMGAGASGMRGRNPESVSVDNHGNNRHPSDPNTFGFAVWQLKDGEEKIIAERLVEIFSATIKNQ
jgi:L-seryl-tRNA(Ser) seleniumtransferase